MNFKQNAPLIIGLLIPVAMIAFVALSIYWPQRSLKPAYDFIYVDSSDNSYPNYVLLENGKYMAHQFAITSGQLTENISPVPNEAFKPYGVGQGPEFFRYSAQTDSAAAISAADVKKLTLNDAKKSPDGYEATNGSQAEGFFPFFFDSSRDYGTVYLRHGNSSKKTSITLSGQYPGFILVGWVLK